MNTIKCDNGAPYATVWADDNSLYLQMELHPRKPVITMDKRAIPQLASILAQYLPPAPSVEPPPPALSNVPPAPEPAEAPTPSMWKRWFRRG